MSDAFDRQRVVMEDSGLGLLPGIAGAFIVALCFIAAILLETWWASILALVAVFATAAAVIFVVWRLLLDGSDDPAPN
jgi:cobalamin synthase